MNQEDDYGSESFRTMERGDGHHRGRVRFSGAPPYCTYLVGKPDADFLVQCGAEPLFMEEDGLPRCFAHASNWALRHGGSEIAREIAENALHAIKVRERFCCLSAWLKA